MFLETRRIPFLHPKSFRSLSKNDREMFFFEKLLKINLYRRKMQLFQAFRKKTCREAELLSGQSMKKNWKPTKKIFTKYFPPKCSYWHIQYTFDNLIQKKVDKKTKKLSLKVRKR